MDPQSPESISIKVGESQVTLAIGNIVEEHVDAVVNAANSSLMGGGGVDGAIHKAGGPEILEECKIVRAERGSLPAGRAVSTTAGNLPARRVIHTVGPIWQGGSKREPETLRSCYLESLGLARELGLKSIAFPSISTGAYRYPVDAAAIVAVRAVSDFLASTAGIDEVRFVLFDNRTFQAYKEALKQVMEER